VLLVSASSAGPVNASSSLVSTALVLVRLSDADTASLSAATAGTVAAAG
jgi:hypothetical protein